MKHATASRARNGAESASAAAPRTLVLVLSALLALASLAWSVFLWAKLADAQAGLPVSCALGGSASCTALWDSPFARAVHLWSRLPIAGWGVLWSALAAVLPTVVVLRGGARSSDPVWPATVCVAIAGMAGVVGLLAVSASLGAFCRDCGLIYLLVGGYGFVVLREAFRHGPRSLAGGALAATLGAGLTYAILLYPAAQTPFVPKGAASIAVSASAPASGDGALGELLNVLGEQGRQQLANALAIHRASEAKDLRPARGLIGSEQAPVRLTEFADLLCSHCAELNALLGALRERLPAGSFSLEPRYFPLDATCNPLIQQKADAPTRCIAAKAMVCVAGRPGAVLLADQLYMEQSRLTADRVYELAAKLVPEVDARGCVDAPDTDAQLRDDIAWAAEHKIQGTPLVLLNGRPVPALPPLLYALILARGDAQHRLFEQLPPAQN